MEKLKNATGQIAILYSTGYGSGLYSWNEDYPQIVFHPELVNAVLKCQECDLEGDEKINFLTPIAERLFPNVYLGGLDGLTIEWLEEGTAFQIEEYDGFEQIKILGHCLCT